MLRRKGRGWSWKTNVDCWSLDPDGGHLLSRVHLERAWLCGVYGCGLVVIYQTMSSTWVPWGAGEGGARTAKGIKVSLW